MKVLQEARGLPPAGTQGAGEATGVPAGAAPPEDPPAPGRPDPEVVEFPTKRRFSAEYKMRIVAEADACKSSGEVGALLRREGLYDSHLYRWRKKQREGALGALAPGKRGPEPDQAAPFRKKITALERENERLKKKLAQAETIIDVQKKVAGLLSRAPRTPRATDGGGERARCGSRDGPGMQGARRYPVVVLQKTEGRFACSGTRAEAQAATRPI
jgi:transposase